MSDEQMTKQPKYTLWILKSCEILQLATLPQKNFCDAFWKEPQRPAILWTTLDNALD